jgi:hypothetical protein
MGAFFSFLLVLALVAQVLALIFWSHAAYLWVQGIEAVVAAVLLTIYAVRFRTHDSRASKWPPLLPLASIAAAGGIKDFYVVLRPETPIWVAVWLLASVGWFLIASLAVWRAERTA